MNCAVCFKDYSASTAGIECGQCHKSVCFCCSVRLLKFKFRIDPRTYDYLHTPLKFGKFPVDKNYIYSCPMCRKENILTEKTMLQSYCFRQDQFENKAEHTSYVKATKKLSHCVVNIKSQFVDYTEEELNRLQPIEQFHYQKFRQHILNYYKSWGFFARREKLLTGIEFQTYYTSSKRNERETWAQDKGALMINKKFLEQVHKKTLKAILLNNYTLEQFRITTYRISNFDI